MGKAADLTRARIATEALALLDDEGIAGMTMRAVARRLNVRAASIYYHFDGQDDLVDAVHDLVDDEIELAGLDDADWRRGLGSVARSYQAAYARHPHAVALVSRRRVVSPRALAFYDRMIGALRARGLADERIMPALGVLDYIALGSAGETFIGGFHLPAEDYRADYPHLAAALGTVDRDRIDQVAFERALESWLDGLEHLLDASAESATDPR